MNGYERERNRLAEDLGYEPDIYHPTTFNEKVLWKKLHVRNPLLTKTTDKYKVRDYVREKLGDEAEDLLIPLIDVTDDPSTLALGEYEPPYVVKANHGCGFNLFVEERLDGSRYRAFKEDTLPSEWSSDEIVDQCRQWLNTRWGLRQHEWAYQNIDRKIMVEEFITDGFGVRLSDVKFFCFSGTPQYILVKLNQEERSYHSVLDSRGRQLDVEYKKPDPVPDRILRAVRPSIPRLRDLAAKLSADFAFCRVDFYVTPDGPYFGEITHYPASGNRRFSPQSFSLELGRHWELSDK